MTQQVKHNLVIGHAWQKKVGTNLVIAIKAIELRKRA